MKRVNVVGTSGSGKSSFSKQLADTLGVEHIEMDQVYWKADWLEPDDEVFFKDLASRLTADSWVLDGNYTRTQTIKWNRCDTVIWLDYGFLRTLLQIVFRSIYRATVR